jgi:hypothetical protein
MLTEMPTNEPIVSKKETTEAELVPENDSVAQEPENEVEQQEEQDIKELYSLEDSSVLLSEGTKLYASGNFEEAAEKMGIMT